MKKIEENTIKRKVLKQNELANLFKLHIIHDEKVPSLQYNINKSIFFKNVDKIPKELVTIYIVKHFDTWQLISEKVYGDLNLWWIICKFNGINDPTDLPIVNTKLKILNRDLVKSIIGELRESK